jgi:hypothetical protein
MSGGVEAVPAAAPWIARAASLRGCLLDAGRPGYRARLAALDAFSAHLIDPHAAGSGGHVAGLAFLAGFLRGSNLASLVAREVPHPDALERFVPAGGRKSLRLVPRGVVCHWIAGNVPLLGMFSWAMSTLAGNVNVVRLSTRQDDVVSPLLDRLARISEGGARVAAETLVVSFDRDDEEAHRRMSEIADVRVAFGGEDAVDAIRALPARWDADTVILGPRVSLAVVDPALVTDRMLSRLVTDIVYFDQLACSSPQRVFLKGRPGEAAFDGFVARFTEAFGRQSQSVPRHALDFGESYRIQLDRARVLIEGGTLHRDSGTSWTVALVDRPLGQVMCANRFVQVVPVDAVETVLPWIPSNVQTVVTVLHGDEASRFTETAALRGVCRFPRPGEGNGFESPWDGVPLLSRLTRWVIRTDSREEAAGQGEAR